MPLIEQTSYNPLRILRNGHIQTLYPYFFRKVDGVEFNRFRLNTHDHDFLDVDVSSVKSDTVVIITHGLEGSSQSPYVKGMTKQFNQMGMDAIAWNQRSCSGQLNKAKHFYHAASIDDLDLVVDFSIKSFNYKKVFLVGFSLGGNVVAYYLGSHGKSVRSEIHGGTIFSSTIHLESTAMLMRDNPFSKAYVGSFLSTMRQKVVKKHELIGLDLNIDAIKRARNFIEFDEHVTAPLHGFKSALDYYRFASAVNHLENVSVPFLIIQSKDDPFLDKGSYPVRQASKSKYVHLEITESGGHCGFMDYRPGLEFWSEKRAAQFIHSAA